MFLAELWIAVAHFFEDSFGAFKSWHCAGAVVGEVDCSLEVGVEMLDMMT
jgi:hypothetical protein